MLAEIQVTAKWIAKNMVLWGYFRGKLTSEARTRFGICLRLQVLLKIRVSQQTLYLEMI